MSGLAPESTISHYRIKEMISHGGMGEVYKAVDVHLGRVVALKTLLPSIAGDEEARRRFMREARAASMLSHPSICTIYEVGVEGDLAFIAMQYVDGTTIHELLAKGPLRLEDALSYALDIADALEEAHRNGVVHRDIKPSNIIVNERGLAVVLDFGLAKQFGPLNDEESPTLLQVTAASVIVGTAPYMSPEQIRNGPVDSRSDIFSFGAMLYEMFAGKRAFSGPGKVEILHDILYKEPDSLCSVNPEMDSEVEMIVGRALKKRPDERYQFVSELKADLLRLIQQRGYTVKGHSSVSIANNATQASRGDRSILAGGQPLSASYWRYLAAFLAAAVLIAGVWWLIAGSRGDPELSPASLRHVQLVNWKGEAAESYSDGTFSRDGKTIAFSAVKDGKRAIWIAPADGERVQVTEDEFNNQNPIWSPDSKDIAFVSRREGETGIWRMQHNGGPPTSIAFLKNFTPQLKYWSKDGATIYYRLNANLFALDVNSGQSTQVTNFDRDHFLRSNFLFDPEFSISPDEQQIAYLDEIDGEQDIWVMPLRGGPSIRVTSDAAEDRHPVWCADGKRIVYSSNRDGTFQICVANISGKKPQQITFGDVDSFVSDVSTDGKRILYGALREEADISGLILETGDEIQVTSDVGCELWPQLSPDAKAIAFQQTKDLGLGNKLKDCAILTGSIPVDGRQIRLAGSGIDPRWSPDGRRLAFLRLLNGAWNIWTVRPTGGDEKQITNHDLYIYGFTTLPLNRLQARYYDWSPDSTRIVYASRDSDGFTLWTVSYDGSNETKLTSLNSEALVFCPLWSPDGNRIAYVSRASDRTIQSAPANEKPTWKLWLREMATGKEGVIYQGDSALVLLGWLGPAGGLLLAVPEGKKPIASATRVSFLEVSVAGSVKPPVGPFESTYLYNAHLSPNRRMIAFVSRQGGRDNAWLVSAAGGEARKITQNTDPRLYYSGITWSPDGRAIYFGKQSRGSVISMIDNFR